MGATKPWMAAVVLAVISLGLTIGGAPVGHAAAADTKKKAAPETAPDAKPKAKSDNKDKSSGKKPAAKADKAKATDAKPDDAPKPIPDSWSADAIAKERQLCRQTLSGLDVVAIPETSFRKGPCGAPAPIRLVSVGKSPQVVLSPPAIMTCRLAAGVHRWVTRELQPLAKKHLKDQIIRIEVMSDYSCRNAYGRKSGRLSEHAVANALDIRGFGTAHGKYVRVLSSWGPTQRDLAAERARAKAQRDAALAADAAAKAEKEKAEAALRAAKKPTAKKRSADGSAPPGEDATKSPSTAKRILKERTRDLLNVGVKLQVAAKRAKQKLERALEKPVQIVPLSKRLTVQGYFLRDAHRSACKVFGTTLGPEANNAHRNHFHVDMTPRRRSNFCE